MSRRILNWEEIYKSNDRIVYSKKLFEYWRYLSGIIANKPTDMYDLVLHALTSSSYNITARYINNIVPIQIPRGDFFTKVNNFEGLPTVLRQIRSSTYCHTVYTYACLRLVMTFLKYKIGDWIACTIGDYQDGQLLGVGLPKWLAAVVERQIKLAQRLGLKDEDPLLFMERWDSFKKRYMHVRPLFPTDKEVLDFHYSFLSLTGKTFKRVTHDFKGAAGLNRGAIIQMYYKDIGIRRKAGEFVLKNHIVGIFAYNRHNNLTIYDLGYCLQETERGIYLIHGTKGVYLAPNYLITQPVIRKGRAKDQNFKIQLPNLGYANAEFYGSIITHYQLMNHTITPHKL